MDDILFIKINFPNGIDQSDSPISNIISDTIEDRQIGKVVNEGTGENYMDMSISLNRSDSSHQEIVYILESLGLSNQTELRYKDDE